MKQEPAISFQALGRIILVALGLFVAWKGLSILVILLIALILSMALSPIADYLHKKLPWLLSVVLVTLLLLVPVIMMVVFMAIAFINQLPDVVISINNLMSTISFIPESLKNIDILGIIQNNADYVLSSTKTIATFMGSLITVIVSTFYIMYDRESLSDLLLVPINTKHHKMVREMFLEIVQVVGHYIRGNLVVSAIASTVMFITLTILGVPFAVPLALFIGIMGLLPYVGPIIAIVPSIILGLAQSPTIGLVILITFLVYQQIENTFIIPTIYNKALNLSPALVFLSVIIGAGTFGILGAFLALPVAASIPVVIKYAKKAMKKIESQKSQSLIK